MEKHLFVLAALCCCAVVGPRCADAELVVTVTEVVTPQGRVDLLFRGAGSVDLTDLTLASQFALQSSEVGPRFGSFFVGPGGDRLVNGYVGSASSSVVGPSDFGDGFSTDNTSTNVSATGDAFFLGAFGAGPDERGIAVPEGYVSESLLRFGMRIEDTDLEDAGLDIGEFKYRWGDSNPDCLTIQVLAEPVALEGDFELDGDVDLIDVDRYIGVLGSAATGDLQPLDLNGDGIVSLDDHDDHVTRLLEAGGVNGTQLGDINLDGRTDVLGDAFILVANLGRSVGSRSEGDLDGDGFVTVLGDAFRLVASLGQSNQ